jgi:hypothetical protein
MLENNIDKNFISSEIVYLAIDELNALLPDDKKLAKEPKTILMGKKSSLDSLNLVNLLVTIDSMVQEKLSVQINLLEKLIAHQDHDNLDTIESLSEFIFLCCDEK